MKQVWPVSIDAGNALVKGVRGMSPPVVFPNLVAPNLNNAFEGFTFWGVEDQEPLIVEWDGQEFAIGDAAQQLSKRPRAQVGYARYDSSDFAPLMAGLLGELYPVKGGTLALTLTLPVDGFGHAAEQVQRLAGKWRFKCRGKSLAFDLPADLMTPVPEAFGSLCFFALNDEGRLVDAELAESRVAVIDIGGYTTDILTFDNLELGLTHGSIERGVIQVRKDVNAAIKREYKRKDLPRNVLEEVIQTRTYYHRNQPHDVGEIVDAAVWELTNGVLEFYNDPEGLDGAVDMHCVIFTGGGAPDIRPYLEAEMQAQGVMHPNPLRVRDQDAATANAIGGHRWAALRRRVL